MNYFIRNENEEIDKIGTFKERFQIFLDANRNFKEELVKLNEILILIARLIPNLKKNSSNFNFILISPLVDLNSPFVRFH
jgi:hypothetical protein